jgi:hypothetical protein
MKLELINHPEIILLESALDEGLREKLIAGLLGAGITATGMLGGQAMYNGGNAPKADNTDNTKQTTEYDQDFTTTGVYYDNGVLVSRAVELNPQAARYAARQQLANFFGGKIPPGAEEIEDEQNGIYSVELRWSKKSQSVADQARQEMQ